jgi:hypothetical protein
MVNLGTIGAVRKGISKNENRPVLKSRVNSFVVTSELLTYHVSALVVNKTGSLLLALRQCKGKGKFRLSKGHESSHGE